MGKKPKEEKIVYACGVAWQHDIEGDTVEVYPSIERLFVDRPSCRMDGCGIVKLKVSLDSWVEEQNFMPEPFPDPTSLLVDYFKLPKATATLIRNQAFGYPEAERLLTHIRSLTETNSDGCYSMLADLLALIRDHLFQFRISLPCSFWHKLFYWDELSQTASGDYSFNVISCTKCDLVIRITQKRMHDYYTHHSYETMPQRLYSLLNIPESARAPSL